MTAELQHGSQDRATVLPPPRSAGGRACPVPAPQSARDGLGPAHAALTLCSQALGGLMHREATATRRCAPGRLLDRAARRLRTTSQLPHRDAMEVLFPRATNHPSARWVYHDERWTRIVHRWEHRALLRAGRSLVVDDEDDQAPPPRSGVRLGPGGAIMANVPEGDEDRWVYLHLKPSQNQWRDFRWSFTALRDTSFREFQIAFRYVDFYNRYRFRHESGHLYFDVVRNGRFFNGIGRTPFAMDAGRPYRFEVDVRGNRFRLTVDGRLQLDEFDPFGLFPRGSIAVILWESGPRPAIAASVTDIQAVEI